MMTRTEIINRLTRERFQVLIIGGGIVGAGIARDAAMRGLKVALIEQGDFASGTSSKTSKLIHGGLRYLGQGKFHLVFESLRERKTLRTIAPALVWPLPLLLPVYRGDTHSPWKIGMGLWLYDLLAHGRNFNRHRMISASQASGMETALRTESLQGVGYYQDCQMDDARLCLVNILQAIDFGAVCCNYVKLQRLLLSNQQLCGGAIEDVLSARSYEVQADVVINATGPWSDKIRRLSQIDAVKQIAPTKGIHLILPRLIRHGIFAQVSSNHRRVFMLPWGDYTLVGTTEDVLREPLEDLQAKAQEVGYLLDQVSRLMPGLHLSERDVIATFAGARPLLSFSGPASRASREHRLERDAHGLISVMGGKYTTYRLMASQAVDLVLKTRRWNRERCLTDQVNLMEGADLLSLDHWNVLTRKMDPELLTKLLTRYGTRSVHILRLLDRQPSLKQPICPHHDYLEAELAYAFSGELACTLTDVLCRRTKIAWSSCQGLDALSTILVLLRQYGKASLPIDQQVKDYKQELAKHLAFRSTEATLAFSPVAATQDDGDNS